MADPSTPPDGALAPLLVDAREAARLLDISARLLWALTNRGAIRSKRIGRLVRYRPEDLRDFIAGQQS